MAGIFVVFLVGPVGAAMCLCLALAATAARSTVIF
jgi:hypothetical protein